MCCLSDSATFRKVLRGAVQSGTFLNERLKERSYNVRNQNGGFLALHCKTCGCSPPLFEKCVVLAKHRHPLTRQILEAKAIAALGDLCVSKPTVALVAQEIIFVRSNLRVVRLECLSFAHALLLVLACLWNFLSVEVFIGVFVF